MQLIAQKDYMISNDLVGKVIHWELIGSVQFGFVLWHINYCKLLMPNRFLYI